jgi:hypothetical protein
MSSLDDLPSTCHDLEAAIKAMGVIHTPPHAEGDEAQDIEVVLEVTVRAWIRGLVRLGELELALRDNEGAELWGPATDTQDVVERFEQLKAEAANALDLPFVEDDGEVESVPHFHAGTVKEVKL